MSMRSIGPALFAGLLSLHGGHALAFGLSDLVYIGIQAGAKLTGAAIDKAVDSVRDAMRDPEAEERAQREKEHQLAQQLQAQIDQIENRPGLRPLDRERLVRQLLETHRQAQELQFMAELAERQRRTQRDSLFSLGGLAGLVGEAALNSPSLAVRRAEILAKDPLYRARLRAQTGAAFAEADRMVAAGIPQARARAALANAQRSVTGDGMQVQLGDAAVARLPVSTANDVPKETEAVGPDAGNAFVADRGRKIWIEFEDAPSETLRLQQLLLGFGHSLAADRQSAEVVYLFQGEYVVEETATHAAVRRSFGELLESPDVTVEAPTPKQAKGWSLARLLGVEPVAEARHGYKQYALLVIARRPHEGGETRVSAMTRLPSGPIEARKLTEWAREELYQQLGL